jgi:hypothetical protein
MGIIEKIKNLFEKEQEKKDEVSSEWKKLQKENAALLEQQLKALAQ